LYTKPSDNHNQLLFDHVQIVDALLHIALAGGSGYGQLTTDCTDLTFSTTERLFK